MFLALFLNKTLRNACKMGLLLLLVFIEYKIQNININH